MFNNPADPPALLPGHPGRCRWHRSLRLGQHAAAPVPEVRRTQGFQRHGRRRSPPVTPRASRVPPSRSKANTPLACLRTETGVHSMVRKSPFDSSGGRHTFLRFGFSSTPKLMTAIEIDINPSDVRTDTFRASGAGWPAHQQDRLGRALDAHSHRHCGAVPGRAQPAQQPRRGLEAPALKVVRSRVAQAPGRTAKARRQQDRRGPGATRSAPTCWTTAASRTCVPTSKSRPRRKCSMATSTCSSKPRSSRVFDAR